MLQAPKFLPGIHITVVLRGRVGSAGLTNQKHEQWPAGFYGAAHKKIKPWSATAGAQTAILRLPV